MVRSPKRLGVSHPIFVTEDRSKEKYRVLVNYAPPSRLWFNGEPPRLGRGDGWFDSSNLDF